MQPRASRAQRLAVMCTASVASVTAGFLLGSLVGGYSVPVPALVVALLAGWLCIAALLVLPATQRSERRAGTDSASLRAPVRTTERDEHTEAGGRQRDEVTGLLRYDAERDDRYVAATGGLPGSVVVVEVADHVTASAIAPEIADRLVADAAARVVATGSTYGAVARRLDGPRLLLLMPGLEEPTLIGLATLLHDAALIARTPSIALRDPSQPVRLVAGVAIADGETVEVTTLVREASTVAAQGKRQGSEAPMVFHDGLPGEARERLVVGRALRTAIDARTIDLVYQPQVDLVDGSLLGVEVLARWQDPVLGAIAPDRFVRVAAEIGMSWQLDRLIFEKAFAQLAEWDAAGVEVPRIFLNVAPQNIADGRRVGLRELLASHRLSPERIAVEIVYDGRFSAERGRATVAACRELGVLCTLDHFGHGGASFGQLTELPVTGIKIDRSLLAEDADEATLSAIIRAGTSLGLAVGAVGIETTAQRDRLPELGCVAGQGYLYAAPLTPDELVDWLRVPNLVA
ncbi:MAG: EAL domain-containing protein [Nocardioides sp.]